MSLQIPERKQNDYFKTALSFLRSTFEIYIEKNEVLNLRNNPKYGFTDLSIVECGRNHSCLILTDDFPLSGYLASLKCDHINLNYIKTEIIHGELK